MKFKSLRPILWTDKFEETIKFYTIVLGFKVSEQNNDWGWASLFKDEVQIMIAKPNEHSDFQKPIFTGSFYFNVDDVDSFWNDLKDKTTICYELVEFEWEMKEFAVYDNNGYILQFGQEVLL